MQFYTLKSGNKIKRVMADAHHGILTWPGTHIPFLDQAVYTAHPRNSEIEELLVKAEAGDSEALEALWQDDILKLALKVSDAR